MENNTKVMISLHCGSMQSTAEKIKDFLRSLGVDVWVCYEMSGM